MPCPRDNLVQVLPGWLACFANKIFSCDISDRFDFLPRLAFNGHGNPFIVTAGNTLEAIHFPNRFRVAEVNNAPHFSGGILDDVGIDLSLALPLVEGKAETRQSTTISLTNAARALFFLVYEEVASVGEVLLIVIYVPPRNF